MSLELPGSPDSIPSSRLHHLHHHASFAVPLHANAMEEVGHGVGLAEDGTRVWGGEEWEFGAESSDK